MAVPNRRMVEPFYWTKSPICPRICKSNSCVCYRKAKIYRLGASCSAKLDIRILAATNRSPQRASGQRVVSGGFVISLECDDHFAAAAGGSREAIYGCWQTIFCINSTRLTRKKCAGFRIRRVKYWRGMNFRATFGSLRILSQERSPLQTAGKSRSMICRLSLNGMQSSPAIRLQSLEEMKRVHIAKVLQTVGGHRDKAASILALPVRPSRRKINKFGLLE